MSQWIFRCVCSLNIFNITNAQILVHHVDIELKRNARRTTIKQIMAFSSLSVSCSGEFNSDFAIYATFNRLLNFLAQVVCVYGFCIYIRILFALRAKYSSILFIFFLYSYVYILCALFDLARARAA